MYFLYVNNLTSVLVQYQRMYQYLFVLASCDDETQRKGIVGIIWTKGASTPMPNRVGTRSKSELHCHNRVMYVAFFSPWTGQFRFRTVLGCCSHQVCLHTSVSGKESGLRALEEDNNSYFQGQDENAGSLGGLLGSSIQAHELWYSCGR